MFYICSVVTVDARVEPVPAFSTNKCSIPPESEMAVQVASDHAPTETTAAIIEPRIASFVDTIYPLYLKPSKIG